MEDQQTQSTSTTLPEKGKGILDPSLIIGLVVGIIIGVLVGILLFRSQSVNNSADKVDQREAGVSPTPVANFINDPSGILSNPIFTEWYGAVSGKVTQKTAESFTIESNGSTLEVFIQDEISKFAIVNDTREDHTFITFEQLEIGSNVEGSVTISRGSLTGSQDQKVTANGILIIE